MLVAYRNDFPVNKKVIALSGQNIKVCETETGVFTEYTYSEFYRYIENNDFPVTNVSIYTNIFECYTFDKALNNTLICNGYGCKYHGNYLFTVHYPDIQTIEFRDFEGGFIFSVKAQKFENVDDPLMSWIEKIGSYYRVCFGLALHGTGFGDMRLEFVCVLNSKVLVGVETVTCPIKVSFSSDRINPCYVLEPALKARLALF